nr:penicillin-binding transpeptidase domain-containing protein [Clostridium thermarum]
MLLVMLLMFGIIAARLGVLQVVKGQEYIEAANNRSTIEIDNYAPRGQILDKNETVLASNRQVYIVTYNQIEVDNSTFFDTMLTLFKILDNNEEKQEDDFPVVIDEGKFSFKFQSESEATRRWMELRFKKDRGFDEQVQKKLYGKIEGELTEDQRKEIDEELLKITAEEVFNKLLKDYKIEGEKVSDLNLETKRKLMIVKDKIKMQSFSEYKPVEIANDLKEETAFSILQQLNDLPGIDITLQPVRTYPFGELASGVLGYISKIPSWQQEKYELKGYDVSTDYIGMSGIEAAYEDRLKGSKGSIIAKVNNLGRVTEELGEKEPYPGQNIQLTIDKDVQSAAEKALDETMEKLQALGKVNDVNMKNATRGAAVAIDVNTGAIIALASRPGFNPNYFVSDGGLSTEQYNRYFSLDLENMAKAMGYTKEQIEKLFPIDKNIENNTTIRMDMYDILPKPMYNYATMATIPPGSTFKPITAIAGLETGVITPSYTINDNGVFNDGKNFIKSFAVGAYGKLNLSSALEVSSNPYFMTVGKLLRENLGDDILAEYAWKLGLGLQSPTGIEIGESYGQMFNTETIQQLFQTQYLWTTMEMLKAGKDSRGYSFPPLDLYDNKDDSDELAETKKDIKTQIKETIKTGNTSVDEYTRLLNKLIELDPKYGNISFSTKDISSAVQAIIGVTVYDAYSQLKIGANTYNASIGQGISSFTPIQMANAIATIVNGGKRYKLHLVDKILSPEGEVIEEKSPVILEKVNLKQETVDAVKEGMYLVDHGKKGTAASTFKNFPITTGGKTGSATFSNTQEEIGRTSYGWYVGFAPYDNPQIAVAVVIFDGGHGAYVAPIAKAIYEEFFKEELSKLNYTKQEITIQAGTSD